MSNADGFNPIRWNCDKQGCFNLKCRPKLQVFADCFPGRINFGDVDGIVEIGGNALMFEWKRNREILSPGQRLMHERLMDFSPFTVFVVVGDAETMDVKFFSRWDNCFIPADLVDLKREFTAWGKWAKQNPVVKIEKPRKFS